jgi:hypothetical protein
LRPILFELAVTQEWAADAPKNFASVMVSYADSAEDPFFLRAWQTSVNEIVRSHSDQISPIVFHPETYESGYLFERFEWIVEQAYQDIFPGGCGIQPALESLEQHLRGIGGTGSVQPESSLTSKSAACKPYLGLPVRDPAPVRYTLIRLCTGTVNELMKRLRSTKTESSRRAVLEALTTLGRSWIIVVPFRWKTKASSEPGGRREQRSGGCVFAIVAPEYAESEVTSKCLHDLAVRFGWMLFRDLWEYFYINGSQGNS